MRSTRFISVSAAVMLGLTAVTVPVMAPASMMSTASAQSQSDPVPAPGYISEGGRNVPLERYTDGRLVAVAPSPNIVGSQTSGSPSYQLLGNTYDMSLQLLGTKVPGSTENIYYWSTNASEGNASDACNLDFRAVSANDPGLLRSSVNGFVVQPAANQDYVRTSVQHWGGSWRFPIATGQPLYNVQVELHFPAGATPTNDRDTVFTGLNRLPLASGGVLFIPEYTLGTPTPRFQAPPSYHQTMQVGPVVRNADGTYTVSGTVEYMPEGSTTLVQFSQNNTGINAADIRITADKFCYAPTTVPQGGSATIASPTNGASGNPVQSPSFSAGDPSRVPAWAKVNSDGTIEVKPGYDVPGGTYAIPVTITYPGKPPTTVMATVTVAAPAPAITYPETLAPQGVETVIEPHSVPGGATFAAGPEIPAWATVGTDGRVTVRPGFTVPPGPVAVPVRVALADGRVIDTTATVVVTNPANPAEQVVAVTQGGTATTVAPANPDGTALPPGTTFAGPAGLPEWITVNDNGTVTASPGFAVPAGATPVQITARFPDGTSDTFVVTVSVVRANLPVVYSPVTVAQGDSVSTGAPQGMPAGTRYSSTDAPAWVQVNPDTGVVTADPGSTTTPGAYTVNVNVTHPDGTSDTVAAIITVTNPNDPQYERVIVAQGQTVTIPVPETNNGTNGSAQPVPSGSTFEILSAPDFVTIRPDGSLDVAPGASVEPKLYEVTVRVTYPDGTTDDLVTRVTVVNPNSPSYVETTIDPGSTATVAAPSNTDSAPFPAGTRFELGTLPDGWQATINQDTGSIEVTAPASATPGERVSFPVTVTYPDGTTAKVEAPVQVNALKDNAAHNPSYVSARIAPGETLDIEQAGDTALSAGTTYALADGYSPRAGWTISVDATTGVVTATAPADAAAGDSEIVQITVTYPDGSTDAARATITVQEAPTHSPAYLPAMVQPGEKVDVSQTGDTSVPAGTEYTLPPGYTPPIGWTVTVDPVSGVVSVTAPEDAPQGEKIVVPVVLTYPDGSTDEAAVTVTVGTIPSGSSDRCIAAGLTVGLPLLLLIPVGLASQVNIPGLDAIIRPIQQQISELNLQLQQQSGIFNADLARLVEQFNAQVNGPAGRALGGVALVAAGLLAAGYVASSCAPGAEGSSGSSDGSSDGSTKGSAEGLLLSSDLSSGSSSES